MPREPSAGPIKVLLLDDDECVRRDYGRLLRSFGFSVDAACDGQDALERIENEDHDVVISDVRMPGMSGLQFLRAVRTRDLDIPVILITGAPDVSSAAEAIEYGAFRYLTKPVPSTLLGPLIEKAAHLHTLARLKREALSLSGEGMLELGDRASLEARFQSALDSVWMAFQPIVDWPLRRVFGYEALVRCTEPSINHPGALFDAAERLDRMHDLGRTIRRRVAEAIPHAPEGALIFVNAHAAELSDPELGAPSAPLSRHAEQVVLEITERSALDRVPGVLARVAELRKRGFRIAIDDLGAGYAGLSSFAQLDPEFVKLDMSLVRDVHLRPKKRSVVRAMTNLCKKELGVHVISEGVECIEERDTLELDGCELLQGYLFARPGKGFPVPTF
jgi:EAL domain-containing protein (putative c-di-GMP-specific phosphodiesterase class I)/ActR/RegA family two-component response regulator